MNIFIDTNVFLDVFWTREPFSKISSEILKLCELGIHRGFINNISIANIDYLGNKQSGKESTLTFLKTIIQFIEITPSNTQIVKQALFSKFIAIEDALQHFSATSIGNIGAIITRDINNFKPSEIPVYTPTEFLKLNF